MHKLVRSRRLAVGTALALSVGLLASCSGDGDDDDYVADGNALCDRTGRELEQALPDFESEPTIEQVMDVARDLEPVLQRWHDGVADLDPPESAEQGHDRLLAALDKSIEQLHAAAESEDGAQVLLDNGGPPLDAPGTAAHTLFDSCPAGDDESEPESSTGEPEALEGRR